MGTTAGGETYLYTAMFNFDRLVSHGWLPSRSSAGGDESLGATRGLSLREPVTTQTARTYKVDIRGLANVQYQQFPSISLIAVQYASLRNRHRNTIGKL